MFTISEHHRIFIAIKPIDFRTRLDGTLAVCKQLLQQNPFSGHLFLFRNKKTTTIRFIVYDHHGFWLLEKRLSKGAFHLWPQSTFDCAELSRAQLYQLIENEPLE